MQIQQCLTPEGGQTTLTYEIDKKGCTMIHTLRELAHYTLGRKRLRLYVIRLVLTHHLIIAGVRAQSTMCGCNCTRCSENTTATHITHIQSKPLYRGIYWN